MTGALVVTVGCGDCAFTIGSALGSDNNYNINNNNNNKQCCCGAVAWLHV